MEPPFADGGKRNTTLMIRIAKKSRSVKDLRPAKAAARKPVKKSKGAVENQKPLRFTIKKDSLGRRYALDKRTGKRISVSKAKRLRRAAAIAREPKKLISKTKTFRGITAKKRSLAAKKGWETRQHNERSLAAKKGWETRQHNERSLAAKRGWEKRRKKVIADTVIGKPPTSVELHKRLWGPERPPSFAEQEGAFIPEGMRMRELGGVADRSELYPKVKAATDIAWINVQVDALRQRQALEQGIKKSTMYTPRFDRLYGEGHGAHVRYDFYAHARDLEDLDQIIDYLDNDEDNDYVAPP